MLGYLPVGYLGRNAHGYQGGGRPGALALDAPLAEARDCGCCASARQAIEQGGHGGGQFRPNRSPARAD